ncbi:hypothetical protein Fmac_015899 [Flemingia macrophylla]|uniref:Bifunctional inhibitor/plant lipid transfer protein/seed storage helical domain-containing protein n=1 Tax=Flemingia macrophylla TaxID=520843 RepID=A0ABD1MFX8_9FABA
MGGDAKAPTADCCSALKQAIKTNKKCVCLVLKHRDDPDLRLIINISITVGLPSICKVPDNISECPVILHLDPKSPEARAFNQMDQNSKGASISPSPTFGTAEESFRNGKKQGADETVTAENGASNVGIKGFFQSFVAVLLIWLS